jgi:hypothetical protein
MRQRKRRGGIAWFFVILGLLLGISGGLIYAWQLNPRVVTDVKPNQLSARNKEKYLIAISMAYAKDRRADNAAFRLAALGMDWLALSDMACTLAQNGYATTNTRLLELRSMVELAQSQGVTGCASQLVAASTSTPEIPPSPTPPTPTLRPPPSKTPTPTLGAVFTPQVNEPTLTPLPSGSFKNDIQAICSADLQNVIEVYVQDVNGTGIPATKIEVAWGGERNAFYTGLKPDKDTGFADFTMTDGETYTVALPGQSDRTRNLKAGSCDSANNINASYRVVFRRVAQ